jgi:uncharacterized damage-inducible protein DinB
MATVSIIDDLYRYNDWAHGRIFGLCQGLTDEQLDAPRPMGFGTLRATLFHILSAEQIWLERWRGVPWRPFPMQPGGATLDQIADGLRRVADERRQLLDRERADGWKRIVTYRDSRQNQYSRSLDDLLLHVANHGIHHRSQALNFLKQFDRTLPAGVDYLFYRLARPTIEQDTAAIEALRAYGLEHNTEPGVDVAWDGRLVQRYWAYHDWANARVLDLAAGLDDAALDRDFQMGPGTIRKTLLHLHDVEPWWLRNWTEGTSALERSPRDMSIADMRSTWMDVARRRDAFIASLDDAGAQRVVAVLAGGPPTKFRVIESLVQLCGHGTHHRAQLINMLRQSGVTPPELDIIDWL